MNSRGSGGNVIAALASFCVPGLGQLCQGRPFAALFLFAAAALLWCVALGWVMHLWATLDAALYRAPACRC